MSIRLRRLLIEKSTTIRAKSSDFFPYKSLNRECGLATWVEGLGLLAQDRIDSSEHQVQMGGR